MSYFVHLYHDKNRFKIYRVVKLRMCFLKNFCDKVKWIFSKITYLFINVINFRHTNSVRISININVQIESNHWAGWLSN